MPTLDFNISEQELSRFKSVIDWLLEREKKTIRDVLDLKISRVKSPNTSIGSTKPYRKIMYRWNTHIYSQYGVVMLEEKSGDVSPDRSHSCVLMRIQSTLQMIILQNPQEKFYNYKRRYGTRIKRAAVYGYIDGKKTKEIIYKSTKLTSCNDERALHFGRATQYSGDLYLKPPMRRAPKVIELMIDAGRDLKDVSKLADPEKASWRLLILIAQFQCNKLIHGDIKPANICYQVDERFPERDIYRFIDFESVREQHQPNVAIYSPGYIAPEFFRGMPLSTSAQGYLRSKLRLAPTPFLQELEERTLYFDVQDGKLVYSFVVDQRIAYESTDIEVPPCFDLYDAYAIEGRIMQRLYDDGYIDESTLNHEQEIIQAKSILVAEDLSQMKAAELFEEESSADQHSAFSRPNSRRAGNHTTSFFHNEERKKDFEIENRVRPQKEQESICRHEKAFDLLFYLKKQDKIQHNFATDLFAMGQVIESVFFRWNKAHPNSTQSPTEKLKHILTMMGRIDPKKRPDLPYYFGLTSQLNDALTAPALPLTEEELRTYRYWGNVNRFVTLTDNGSSYFRQPMQEKINNDNTLWDKITTNHDRLSKQWLSSSEIYALFYQEDVNGLALLENEQLTVAPSSSYRTEAGGCVSSLLRFFSSLNPFTTTAQKVGVYTCST